MTYTSKNEFYVIDILKTKKQNEIGVEDAGISTTDVDNEEEEE